MSKTRLFTDRTIDLLQSLFDLGVEFQPFTITISNSSVIDSNVYSVTKSNLAKVLMKLTEFVELCGNFICEIALNVLAELREKVVLLLHRASQYLDDLESLGRRCY